MELSTKNHSSLLLRLLTNGTARIDKKSIIKYIKQEQTSIIVLIYNMYNCQGYYNREKLLTIVMKMDTLNIVNLMYFTDSPKYIDSMMSSFDWKYNLCKQKWHLCVDALALFIDIYDINVIIMSYVMDQTNVKELKKFPFTEQELKCVKYRDLLFSDQTLQGCVTCKRCLSIETNAIVTFEKCRKWWNKHITHQPEMFLM